MNRRLALVLTYQISESLMMYLQGILLIFIARKSLRIADWHIPLLQSSLHIGMLLVIPLTKSSAHLGIFNRLLLSQCLNKFFLVTAVLCESPGAFIASAVAALIFRAPGFSIFATILKHWFSPEERNRVFSLSVTLSAGLILCYSWFAGNYLAEHPGGHLPIIAFPTLLSLLPLFAITLIGPRDSPIADGDQSPVRFSKILAILLTDQPFNSYVQAFTLFGLANLFLLTIEVIFITDYFNADYREITRLKGVTNNLCILFTSIFWGWWMNKKHDPFWHRGFFNLFFIAHNLCFLAGWWTHDIRWIYPGIIILSLVDAPAQLNWLLGPQYFAVNNNSEIYGAASLLINGFRGILGPITGLLIYRWFGFGWVFATMLALILISTFLLFHYSGKFALHQKMVDNLP